MELRHHPLMSYRGFSTWPPIWVCREPDKPERLRGEVGILKELRTAETLPHKCFLVIEHEQAEYIGCLLFSDQSFCDQIINLLREHCGDSIQHIGSLDLSYTL